MSRREYARLRVDVWEDDFRELTSRAQWVYLHLLTHPSLSFCGVVDYRPKRIAAAAVDLLAADVEAAVQELIEGRFVVVDHDTEEALIRSFVRHDGLLASPNVTVAMVREFRAIASPYLRGVFVHELRRLHVDEPDAKGWPKAEQLLVRAAIDPYPTPPGNPSRNPSGNPPGNPSLDPPADPSEPDREPLGEPLPHSVLPAVDSVLPAPGTGTPPSATPSGGSRAGARGGAAVSVEPPPRCPRHLDAPAAGSCGPCGDARRDHERWTREREQARRDAGLVVGGLTCVQHPSEPAGRCGRCAAEASPMPADELRAALGRRRAS